MACHPCLLLSLVATPRVMLCADVTGNGVGFEGAKFLGTMLKKNSSITVLNLHSTILWCRVDDCCSRVTMSRR
jgi:NCAIR mutase (PurE)-related protein